MVAGLNRVVVLLNSLCNLSVELLHIGVGFQHCFMQLQGVGIVAHRGPRLCLGCRGMLQPVGRMLYQRQQQAKVKALLAAKVLCKGKQVVSKIIDPNSGKVQPKALCIGSIAGNRRKG